MSVYVSLLGCAMRYGAALSYVAETVLQYL